MTADVLDDIDRGVLYYLQQDARNSTSTEMGEKLDVAASTVRNRMAQMEERGIIEGYQPKLDYEKAGFRLHILFTCTAPDESEHVAEDILDQEGVVTVREILGDSENLRIEAVGRDTQHLTEIADSLREMGISLVRSEVLKNEHRQPFNHFGHRAVPEVE